MKTNEFECLCIDHYENIVIERIEAYNCKDAVQHCKQSLGYEKVKACYPVTDKPVYKGE